MILTEAICEMPEAAISHGNLFARVDVLRKIGSQIELIEVNVKSFDSRTDQGFRGARGGIDSGMKPYLLDVAFQRHVLGLAYADQAAPATSSCSQPPLRTLESSPS